MRLFAERGYAATTVADITEAADVAPRTFFLHFAAKEDVLLDDLGEVLRQFRAELASRPPDEAPVTAIRAALVSSARTIELSRAEVLLKIGIMLENPAILARNIELFTGLESLLREEVERRAVGLTDLDAALIAAAATTARRVAITVWYRRGGGEGLAELVATAFDRLSANPGMRRGR
jgi:AcrR family transcriptional regulator